MQNITLATREKLVIIRTHGLPLSPRGMRREGRDLSSRLRGTCTCPGAISSCDPSTGDQSTSHCERFTIIQHDKRKLTEITRLMPRIEKN